MQKADSQEQQETPAQASRSGKVLQDVRQLVNILILAWKNYGLYPEDHVSTVKSLENLVTAFDKYFTDHGDLRLTVEKDRLLCGSESVHEIPEDAPSEDITTLLYRDGIKWIEFQEGIPLEEIGAFFRIAYKYRLFAEETEGDIVTALMDEELDFIDFKAVDIFWQDLLLMDFSKLPPPAPRPEDDAGQKETGQPEGQVDTADTDVYARSITDPSISEAQLELSDTDHETLVRMVKEEENWDITEDLFEVLLIILKSQSDPENFEAVLEFISEEVVETIEHDKFDLLVNLFQAIDKLFPPETSDEKDWRRPLVNRFFRDISTPEIFQLVSDKLLKLQMSEIEKLKALYRTLHYFTPDIIPYLMPVIMQRSSPEIQQMISAVIVHLSKRNMGPLEKMAEKHGAEMGDKLLVILGHLQGDRANKILYKMCDHPSDKVRRKAIKQLVDRDSKYAQRLFSLVDDPSKEIRSCILAAIAKHKSGALENQLLNYLKENSAKKEPAHILACYKTLGRCGSNTSVPYLRRILLNRGWNSFIGSGKPVFRQGAAIALALLGTPEAEDALKKASKSRFKVIRNAFDSRQTASGVSGEKNDD